MYHEFRDSSRSNWKYTYTGQDLVKAAKNKLAEYHQKETAERTKMTKFLEDRSKSIQDNDVRECEKKIAEYGAIVEQLEVFVYEFQRKPDREYHLSLGDVVFFGLHQDE